MSSNSTKKNKNTKIQKTEEPTKESLTDKEIQDELNRYLKITEKEIKSKQIDDEAISNLKKNNEEMFETIIKSKNEENIDELYNLLIEEVKYLFKLFSVKKRFIKRNFKLEIKYRNSN